MVLSPEIARWRERRMMAHTPRTPNKLYGRNGILLANVSGLSNDQWWYTLPTSPIVAHSGWSLGGSTIQVGCGVIVAIVGHVALPGQILHVVAPHAAEYVPFGHGRHPGSSFESSQLVVLCHDWAPLMRP